MVLCADCHGTVCCAFIQACLQLAEQCLTLAAEEEMTASLQEALNTYATGPAGNTTRTANSTSVAEPAHATVQADGQARVSSSGTAAVSAEAQAAEAVSTDEQQPASPDTEDGAGVTAVPPSPAAAAAPAVAAPAAWDAGAYAAACEACRTRAAQHQQDAAALYDSIKSLVDAATAHVLHVSAGAHGVLCCAALRCAAIPPKKHTRAQHQ